MGGKGGGVDIPDEVERAAQQLLDIGIEQFELGVPLLELGAEQGQDVLAGGVGGFLPAIQNQLQEARVAQSQGLVQAREDLTRAGITGTELQNQLAQARFAAESEVGQVPAAFTLPLLEAATSEAFRLPAEGIQGIASSATGAASAALPGQQPGGIAGGLGGAASGALTGAQVGSIFPGPGTLIGAGIGALGGGAKGAK